MTEKEENEKCLCGFHAASVTHSLLQINEELEKIEHAYHPNLTGVDNLLITASHYLEKLPELCGIKVDDLQQLLNKQADRVGKWQKMREEAEDISPELGSEYDIAQAIKADLGKVWLEFSTRLSNCNKMKQK
jgi:hypothetical protein